MTEEIKLGRYKHFKGNFYEVLGIAHHSETNEAGVVYMALYSSRGSRKNLIKPVTPFLNEVQRDQKTASRFQHIDDLMK